MTRVMVVLLVAAATLVAAVLLHGHTLPSESRSRVSASLSETPSEGEGEGELQTRDVWFYGQRGYPKNAIPPGAYLQARGQQQRLHAERTGAASNGETHNAVTPPQLAWSELGPHSVSTYTSNWYTNFFSSNYEFFGSAPVAGRVTAIATDPTAQDTAYIGGAAGGVWKTTDGGADWAPVFDQAAPAIAIGSIAVDPNAHNTVYAGTGEANFGGDSYFGSGVYKSTQGGANGTWQKLSGAGFNFDNCYIADIAVKPGDSQTVLVAVDDFGGERGAGFVQPVCNRGVYRSTTAGADFARVTTRCEPTDLAVDPSNSNVWYGGFVQKFTDSTECGVYKSVDAGANWTQSNGTSPNALPSGKGRVRLAVASGRIYAAISDCVPGTTCANTYPNLLSGKLWTSTDGSSWSSVPAAADFCDVGSGGQCNYDLAIAVSPSNANLFYAAGIKLFKYIGGETTAPPAVGFCDSPCSLNSSDIHVDFHALAFDAGGRLWAGSDGGVYRTSDGSTFTNLNKDLNLIQFYPGTSGSVVGPLLGGAQDNGVSVFVGDKGWGSILGADGAFAAVDPSNPKNLYGSTQNLTIYKSSDGGKTIANAGSGITGCGRPCAEPREFIAPMVMDPTNSRNLYAGTMRVWKTTNSAGSWSAISPAFGDTSDTSGNKITAIAPAPSDASTIYVGTSGSTTGTGTASQIRVTRNGGTTDIASWPNKASSPFPNRYVTDIAVNDTNAGEAYVAVSGFGTGHVFKTTSYGDSWSDISSNLPDSPANAIVVDTRTNPVTAYVGTDVGVFWASVPATGTPSWIDANNGLPNTVVMDLILDKTSNQLIAATHGRGAWTADVAPPAGPGGKIAFVSNRDGDNEIFTENSNGTAVTKLTDNAFDDAQPSWSPDRTKIAFVSNRDGNYEIYSMNSDGTNVVRLTNNSANDFWPTWSGDGAQIAFSSNRDGDNEVFKINADGSGVTQLTSNTADDAHPSWSPKGSQIAFHSNRDGDYEVFKMNADGSAQTQLTSNTTGDGEADWSNDGTKIAFDSNRDGDTEIYAMNADGTGVTQLTSNTSIDDVYPSWAPDDTQIAFASNRDGDYNNFEVSSVGGAATRLTSDLGTDTQPSWQPAIASATTPGAPQNVTASPGNVSAAVSWSAPASDGGSPVTNYVVTPYIGSIAQAATTVGNVLSTTVTGLKNGTTYTFKVAAKNSVGVGPDSVASNSVMPRAAVADFNGDESTDVSVFRPSEGRWYIRRSSDNGLTLTDFGTSTDVPVPADYDGDGKTDVAVFRPSEGRWYIRRSIDGALILSDFGTSTDVPVPADYDGDGKADIAVFRPSEGRWYIRRSSDNVLTLTDFGTSTDIQVPADYNGDGKADIAVFRPSEGRWYIRRSSDNVLVLSDFGTSSDLPLPADYDGDGKADVAVFRRAEGRWYVRRSSDSGLTITDWGTSSDRTEPGDYDGDGKSDVTVFRPTEGRWYIHRSSDSGLTLTDWGISTDIQLSLPYAIRKVFFP
jgi:putative transposon-encoded protein